MHRGTYSPIVKRSRAIRVNKIIMQRTKGPGRGSFCSRGEKKPVNTADVIIPVYKPDRNFLTLIEKLDRQTIPVNRILILNTEEKYFDRLIYGTSFFEKYRNVEVTHLSKKEFNHGGTRRRGVERSEAAVFVMMTQDALPADEYLIERLVLALEEKGAAVAYARQLPAEGCSLIERCARDFNYPPERSVKSLEDMDRLGIKTFFCSNVCAAYRREAYDGLGGFVKYTIFNEDMIYAAAAVRAGYRVVYEANARVVHSHNYTCMQQLRRNFDMGVSQAEHPEVFSGLPAEKEGMRLVRKTRDYLMETGNKRLIPYLYISSLYKYAGYVLGKNYRRLPCFMIKKCTSNQEYWEQAGAGIKYR